MFSALRQGSILYILEKGENPVLKTGQVTGVTHPSYNGNFLTGGGTVDINVRCGEQNMDFKNVPASLSVTGYNNVIIAETRELMSVEVENLLHNSREAVSSVDYHRNVISSCEEILKTINPGFARESERDRDICDLKGRMGGMESKMDEILSLLSKEKTKQDTKA